MTRNLKHLGSYAGTSFTKASVSMHVDVCPVVIRRQWKNQGGSGFEG